MKTYTINNFNGDRKALKKYIEDSNENYTFPCKLEIYDEKQSLRKFYAEESNIVGSGLLLIDWKHILI